MQFTTWVFRLRQLASNCSSLDQYLLHSEKIGICAHFKANSIPLVSQYVSELVSQYVSELVSQYVSELVFIPQPR